MEVQEWLGENNKLGIDIWNKKYRNNDESFDEWLDRVSAGDKDIRKLIEQKKFLFAGRILAGRGCADKKKQKMTLSNCYVLPPVEDNLESIFDTAKHLARTFSYGGGVGIDISKLAPNKAKVRNSAKSSTGAVSFMDLYSLTTGLIGQNNRMGALIITMDVTHPDIESFITVKNDLDKVTKANISVKITDEFMMAAMNNEKFHLTFKRNETGEEFDKEVNARDLFKLICQNAWDNAEPGVLFWDMINRYNLMQYDDNFKLAGVNPCVSGDTLLLTSKGYVKIKDVVDQEIEVWNGHDFTTSTPQITGHNQKMLRVTTDDGCSVDCTLYHKFILDDDTRVEAKDLKVGQKLARVDRWPVIHGENQIKMMGNKFVPDHKYTVRARLNWLEDYIHFNSCISNSQGTVYFISKEFKMLLRIKYMLNTLGANGYVENEDSDTYRLVINAYNINKLKKLGFRADTIPSVDNPKENEEMCPKITSIEEIKDSEVVYCLNEKGRHSVIFNGMMTGQCSEQALPSGGACLLGSMNLANYVSRKKEFDFCNFKKDVKLAIKALNQVLDEGIPLHPLRIQRESARDWRPTGLGIMGLADMLIKMEIPYGSETSLVICDSIGNAMACAAIEQSYEEASISGSFPKCTPKHIINSNFYLNHIKNDKLTAKIEETGLRNCQLLCVAPTGTLSTMLGISGGVEPIFDLYYTRTTKSLGDKDKTYNIYTQIVWDYMQEHNIKEGDEYKLPNWFITAKDINYKNRVKMQGVWQKHIDVSISSTVNLPNSATVEDVMDLYTRAWSEGCKGITIFREGCRRVPILESTKKDEKKEDLSIENKEEFPDDTIAVSDIGKYDKVLKRGEVIKAPKNCIGKNRDLITGCGSLHCQAFFDAITGDIVMTYLSKGSEGGCNSFMVGLSRMISMAGRAGVNVYAIADQLKSAPSCTSYMARRASKHDTSKGICCPSAVGHAIIEMYEEVKEEIDLGGIYKGSPLYNILNEAKKGSNITYDEILKNLTKIKEMNVKDIPKFISSPKKMYLCEKPLDRKESDPQEDYKNGLCPICQTELVFEGGCNTCKSCGWSKCD